MGEDLREKLLETILELEGDEVLTSLVCFSEQLKEAPLGLTISVKPPDLVFQHSS